VRNKWNKGRDVQIQAFLLATMDTRLTTSAMTRSASFLGVFLDELSSLVGILGAPVVEHGLLQQPLQCHLVALSAS